MKGFEKKNQVFTYFLLSLYVGLISVILLMVYFIPTWVQKVEVDYIVEIQEKVEHIITSSSSAEMPERLNNLRDTFAFEISVSDNSEGTAVYSSLPVTSDDTIKDRLNSLAVLYEAESDIAGASGNYSVWYAVYHPELREYFTTIFNSILLLIAVVLTIIFILVWILQKMMYTPLKVLKKNVYNLRRYRFSKMDQRSNDKINENMLFFAYDLNHRMKKVSHEFTELEYALQLEKQRLEDMLLITKGLVHDLKSPLHQTIIEIELQTKNNAGMTTESISSAHHEISRLEDAIGQINDILLFVNSDVRNLTETIDDFDIIKLYFKMKTGFENLIVKRNLSLDSIMDEKLIVHMNKIICRLIIHNMLTNSINYARDGSEIIFEIEKINGYICIICTNEASENDMIRMQNSENIFMKSDDCLEQSETEHQYSSGQGLYLIKELAIISGGTYELNIKENIVEIKILMPQEPEEAHDEA